MSKDSVCVSYEKSLLYFERSNGEYCEGAKSLLIVEISRNTWTK